MDGLSAIFSMEYRRTPYFPAMLVRFVWRPCAVSVNVAPADVVPAPSARLSEVHSLVPGRTALRHINERPRAKLNTKKLENHLTRNAADCNHANRKSSKAPAETRW
jgi:hypothetical protein